MLKSMVRMNLLSLKLWMKEEKAIHVSFGVAAQTWNVRATANDMYIVNMEKALNLYKTFWERGGPHSHNFYYSILL